FSWGSPAFSGSDKRTAVLRSRDTAGTGVNPTGVMEVFTNNGGSLALSATFEANGNFTGSKGIVSKSATSGIGYMTGAGGTITQNTSKSTGVTLNTATGAITMNNAALSAGNIVSFTMTNSAVASFDAIVAMHESAGTPGGYTINARSLGGGSASFDVRNNTAG